jgi:hypothetical protein
MGIHPQHLVKIHNMRIQYSHNIWLNTSKQKMRNISITQIHENFIFLCDSTVAKQANMQILNCILNKRLSDAYVENYSTV